MRAFGGVLTAARGTPVSICLADPTTPGGLLSPMSATPRSGNYLLYWMASQALWRLDPKEGKGFGRDGCIRLESPSVNRNNTLLTAGLRFNEPLPLRIHNTMALGYVRNRLSSQFLSPGMPAWKTEQGVEFNALLDVLPMLLLQPVIQYYANLRGGKYSAPSFLDSEQRWISNSL